MSLDVALMLLVSASFPIGILLYGCISASKMMREDKKRRSGL